MARGRSKRKYLTLEMVKKISPTRTGERREIWDAALPGFGLRIGTTAKSDAFVGKVYFLRKRGPDGSMVRLQWAADLVGLDEARSAAQEAIARLRRGEVVRAVEVIEKPIIELDPHKRAMAQALRVRQAPPRSVRDLAYRWWRSTAKTKRTSSRLADLYMLLRYVAPSRWRLKNEGHPDWPTLSKIRVDAVRWQHVLALHEAMADKPYAANRCLALISTMFSFAIKHGWATVNPKVGVRRYPEEGRQRPLKLNELATVMTYLDATPNQEAADVLRLTLLTGARPGEVMGATWGQFDLDEATWTKPSTTKQKRVHHVTLAPAAVEILKRRRAAITGEDVFPGRYGAGHQKTTRPRWGRISARVPSADKSHRKVIRRLWDHVREACGLPDVRPYDATRHTHATILASRGVPLHTVGKSLGHASVTTTQRYAHLYRDTMREAASVVADAVGAATVEQRTGQNVVPMKP